MNKPQSQYKETQILTASPEKLLIMLYDAAIVCLETAISYLEQDKPKFFYDKVNTQLLKSQEIIGELMSTLDLEKGGDIALHLQSLYAYFLQRIMEGNINKEIQPIKEVLNHMQELRNSWKEALQKQTHTISGYKNNISSSGGFNISG